MDSGVSYAVTSWDEGVVPEGPVLVLLHGFGSNEEYLAGVGRVAAEALGIDWVSLRAPSEREPGSYAWFPITTPGRPDPASVTTAAVAVDAWCTANLANEATRIPV